MEPRGRRPIVDAELNTVSYTPSSPHTGDVRSWKSKPSNYSKKETPAMMSSYSKPSIKPILSAAISFLLNGSRFFKLADRRSALVQVVMS
jgi:hypothetical protein